LGCSCPTCEGGWRVEVSALSSLFGGLFMILTEFYGPGMTKESRILQNGRMRSEKVVAWKSHLL
jgi:hypothetical protein